MSLYETARVLHGVGPYDKARRRAARAKVSPERRREIGRLGGAARMAKLTPEERLAMARRGVETRLARIPAARRREIGSLGARALNASVSVAQKRAWGRKAGLASAAARRALSGS